MEKLTGVDVKKLVPVPDLSNKAFPEARKHEDKGLHLKLFTFSPNDYQRAGEIFNGEHPEDGQPLEVVFGAPEGSTPPNLDEEPQLNAPGAEDYDLGMFKDIEEDGYSIIDVIEVSKRFHKNCSQKCTCRTISGSALPFVPNNPALKIKQLY